MQSNTQGLPQPLNPNPNFHRLIAPNVAPAPVGHRRARSEQAFRIPDDLGLGHGDPLGTESFDEIGTEDDLFCTFMDIEKIGCRLEASGSEDRTAESSGGGGESDRRVDSAVRPKHRHSSSMDGSSLSSSVTSRGESAMGELLEAKKAMTAEQLAALAAIDPKKAKRILANRQSAARSKERKARYISELERKVQTLQTEATTLSAQLTLYQRDTTGLSAENTELKLRLKAMEQQAQLRDALNEALKQEVQRLKLATDEMSNPSTETYNEELPHDLFNRSFFMQPPSHHQGIHLQTHFNQSPPNAPNHRLITNHHTFPENQQHDHIRGLQGLDIGKGSNVVKSESPSASAGESSSTL